MSQVIIKCAFVILKLHVRAETVRPRIWKQIQSNILIQENYKNLAAESQSIKTCPFGDALCFDATTYTCIETSSSMSLLILLVFVVFLMLECTQKTPSPEELSTRGKKAQSKSRLSDSNKHSH